jgi:hypothetical protein
MLVLDRGLAQDARHLGARLLPAPAFVAGRRRGVVDEIESVARGEAAVAQDRLPDLEPPFQFGFALGGGRAA